MHMFLLIWGSNSLLFHMSISYESGLILTLLEGNEMFWSIKWCFDWDLGYDLIQCGNIFAYALRWLEGWIELSYTWLKTYYSGFFH